MQMSFRLDAMLRCDERRDCVSSSEKEVDLFIIREGSRLVPCTFSLDTCFRPCFIDHANDLGDIVCHII